MFLRAGFPVEGTVGAGGSPELLALGQTKAQVGKKASERGVRTPKAPGSLRKEQEGAAGRNTCCQVVAPGCQFRREGRVGR